MDAHYIMDLKVREKKITGLSRKRVFSRCPREWLQRIASVVETMSIRFFMVNKRQNLRMSHDHGLAVAFAVYGSSPV